MIWASKVALHGWLRSIGGSLALPTSVMKNFPFRYGYLSSGQNVCLKVLTHLTWPLKPERSLAKRVFSGVKEANRQPFSAEALLSLFDAKRLFCFAWTNDYTTKIMYILSREPTAICPRKRGLEWFVNDPFLYTEPMLGQ